MRQGVRLTTAARTERLGSLAPYFRQLFVDDTWRAEVETLRRARHGRLHTYAQRLARVYVSDFDANALTRMYRMQLLTLGAWQQLLGQRAGGRLLDVGAGSGDVTAVLGQCFEEVVATEVSRGMARRLAKRGVRCHALDLSEAPLPEPPFDAVSLLNVLDRCSKPRTLLRNCLAALKPGGTFIVALALPYRPFYFDGPRTPDPLERLECAPTATPNAPTDAPPNAPVGAGAPTDNGTAAPTDNGTAAPTDNGNWEDGARRLIERDLLPLGLELDGFARAPYLSAGDSARELYELDDVLVVLSKR